MIIPKRFCGIRYINAHLYLLPPLFLLVKDFSIVVDLRLDHLMAATALPHHRLHQRHHSSSCVHGFLDTTPDMPFPNFGGYRSATTMRFGVWTKANKSGIWIAIFKAAFRRTMELLSWETIIQRETRCGTFIFVWYWQLRIVKINSGNLIFVAYLLVAFSFKCFVVHDEM